MGARSATTSRQTSTETTIIRPGGMTGRKTVCAVAVTWLLSSFGMYVVVSKQQQILRGEASAACPERLTSNTLASGDTDAEQRPSAVTGRLFSGKPVRPRLVLGLGPSERPAASTYSRPASVVVGVTTTLKSRAKCVAAAAEVMPVVVVGDEGGERWNGTSLEPSGSTARHEVVYLGLDEQRRQNDTGGCLYCGLAREVPTRSFSRKNFGYIYAVKVMGAEWVWDFDDDNCLGPDARSLIKAFQGGQQPDVTLMLADPNGQRVVNPYLLYGAPTYIWPRGYPLLRIGERRFPVLDRADRVRTESSSSSSSTCATGIGETSISVLQMMQDVDPDVDAIWRIENAASSLPLTWAPSDAVRQQILAVHPRAWAPYNAQATLTRRRAVMLSYLPHTVHGRVADIWRSYVVQYMLKWIWTRQECKQRRLDLVGFTGAFASHFRNSHNYAADMEAEQPLYQQTAELVALLHARLSDPLRLAQRHVGREFVDLYNELYSRGYVERGDVHGAAAWADALRLDDDVFMEVVYRLNPSGSQRSSASVASLWTRADAQERLNVTAVVHFNKGLRYVVPSWMAVWAHRYARVLVYVATSPRGAPIDCAPISGVEIRCSTNDYDGWLAYQSTVHAIRYDETVGLGAKGGTLGYLFVHDDVAVRNLAIAASGTVETEPLGPANTWCRNHGDKCYPAIAKFAMASGWQFHIDKWHGGSGDQYYIAAADARRFADFAEPMLAAGVFLEAAVPTLIRDVLRSDRVLGLATSWSAAQRNSPLLLADKWCAKKDGSDAPFLHPVKLSSLNGILAQLKCS